MTDIHPYSFERRRRSRSRWLLVAIPLIAAALAVYAWNVWSSSASTSPSFIYATAQRADFEDLVSATGALQPRDYVDVGAQISGQLRRLHVEVGSDVVEGQLLAEIDAEQSVARVEASRASLRAQQAQLAQSQANFRKAERDLLRLQNLWKANATTLELVENAETVLETTRAQIDIQEAQIAQLQASMRVDETNLNYTRIHAPMAGTVVSMTAKQGETLNTNQSAPTILRIADLSVMTVQTQVSEADISKLRVGMPAYFTTLGSQGQRWYGELGKIEPTPTVTNNVVLYNALFDVENTSRTLMSQMTAQVFFVVAEARDALVVPMAAVTFQRVAPPARDALPKVETTGATVVDSVGERTGERRGSTGEPRAAGGQARSREDEGSGAATTNAAGEGADARPRRTGSGTATRPPQGTEAPGQSALRRATVKIADGESVVEREVIIGVSSRVQAQVLSGLSEGERVVVGVRQAETERAAFTPSSPPDMPPGVGMGPGAGGMRR